MNLGELKDLISDLDKDIILPVALCNPHSYRGRYDEVAFEPKTNVKVSDLLSDIDDALENCHEGWKGGEYFFKRTTPIHIEYEGVYSSNREVKNFINNFGLFLEEYDMSEFDEKALVDLAIKIMIAKVKKS